jgi:Fungal Zn(2)-Cys(6) binuclear cluster domain
MSHSSVARQIDPHPELKHFSCLICRQRKVKCDRRNPCTNCVRAAKECSFVAPVRGRRKRRKTPKEGLHARLRRYEDLLRSYGARIESPDDADGSDVETESDLDVDMVDDSASSCKQPNNLFAFDESKPKLVTMDGSSRYFDKCVPSCSGTLCSLLADILQHHLV